MIMWLLDMVTFLLNGKQTTPKMYVLSWAAVKNEI